MGNYLKKDEHFAKKHIQIISLFCQTLLLDTLQHKMFSLSNSRGGGFAASLYPLHLSSYMSHVHAYIPRPTLSSQIIIDRTRINSMSVGRPEYSPQDLTHHHALCVADDSSRNKEKSTSWAQVRAFSGFPASGPAVMKLRSLRILFHTLAAWMIHILNLLSLGHCS